METVDCNLCGSSEHAFVYRRPDGFYFTDEWFDVVECRGCGLGFVNPRPTIEEIGRFYPNDYYGRQPPEDYTRRYEAQARYLQPLEAARKRPRLLDVGCAVGDFPRHMARRGWDVEAVEPFCPAPIDDFPVYREPFDKLSGLAGRFDALTAWAVLEHVHDPMAYFLKAAEVLKPGGLFVFVVTNFESLSSKRLFQEDVPRHLIFFTKVTVRRYLAKVGLEIVRADFNDRLFPMGARGTLNYLYVTYVKGRLYGWEDQPATFSAFLEESGLRRGFTSAARFVVANPMAALDRLAEPLVLRWQMLTRSYGIATYVARKP